MLYMLLPLLLLSTAPMYTILSTTKYHIVNCTHIGSATAFGNNAQENTTADIAAEDQLQPPLDMAKVRTENCTNQMN